MHFFALFYKKYSIFFAGSEKSRTFALAFRETPLENCKNSGVWCNGNTADSGPAFPGSSPGTPTRKSQATYTSACVFCFYQCRSFFIYRQDCLPLY